MYARVTAVALLSFLLGGQLAAVAQEPSGLAVAVALQRAMVSAIAKAEKSVVAIARVRRERPGESSVDFRPDAFGRRALPLNAPQPMDPDFIPNEFGAGVVIDARGLVLTHYSLLADDCDYYVTTVDRRIYRAWVKGADPRSDLAVLAFDATELTPISFRDGGALRKGEIVVALGNPHAIARDGQASAGWGIVANLGRKAPAHPDESDVSGRRTLHHFGTLIQTDAKLNQGTSGGALVNLDGQMVGLTVAAGTTPGVEAAAGYAIPVDATFRRVVETLKQGREVEYGFLGVQPKNLTPQERVTGLHGLRVDRVVPGTPAAKHGVKTDDIITAVDGTPIYDADGLVLEVGRLPVEAVAKLSVVRSGRPRTVDVTLGKYPVRGKKVVTAPVPSWRGLRVDYGTMLLDSDFRARNGVLPTDEGVAVAEVEEGSAAWQAGLRGGMLVTHAAGTVVRNPKEFYAIVQGRNGAVALRGANQGDTTTFNVKP